MPDESPARATRLAGPGDTIAAIATAPGRGAVALVRVSGPRASEIVGRVAAPWPPAPRTPTLCTLRAPGTGELLDRALVTRFEAPRSYTGEDAVEVSTHGGALVPARVLAALLDAGARQALPGEFTRRAVLAGKLDILQAEAVADLVDARSAAAQRSALAQLDGGLSRRILALRDALLDVEALIAYDIDFPEEDEGAVAPARIAGACDRVLTMVDALLATVPAGTVIREGAVVVIAGAPNVGKSSLFNALLGAARAIVTELPGTTRDALEAVLDTGRWPLRLVDTAGLRATRDAVERLGIEVSERYLGDAEAVLVCAESPAEMEEALARVRRRTTAPLIAVWTKRDLHPGDGDAQLPSPPGVESAVAVSAESGLGLGALVAAAEAVLARRHGEIAADAPLLTRTRHRQALERARGELAAFRQGWSDARLPAPVAAVHLRAAVGALEELIGVVDLDDVLDRVFGAFCIGK